MSQTIYMRHPISGDEKHLSDPKSEELVPLMVQGYVQVAEPAEKPSILAPLGEPSKTLAEVLGSPSAAPVINLEVSDAGADSKH